MLAVNITGADNTSDRSQTHLTTDTNHPDVHKLARAPMLENPDRARHQNRTSVELLCRLCKTTEQKSAR